MAGRGRGRGSRGRGFTFDVSALGLGRGKDAMPAPILQPPPLYPVSLFFLIMQFFFLLLNDLQLQVYLIHSE